jgi:hypothetical protein
MNGDLLVTATDAERQAVARLLRDHGVVERYIWIGLYRINYVWNDQFGGGTEMSYSHFDLKQPRPADGLNQLRCVYIDPRYSFAWYTGDCSLPYDFVCQFDYQTITAATTPEVGASTTVAPVPKWFIGLLVLAAFLAVCIIVLTILLCIRKCRSQAVKPKSIDVRSKAPIPHSGPILDLDGAHNNPSTSRDQLV